MGRKMIQDSIGHLHFLTAIVLPRAAGRRMRTHGMAAWDGASRWGYQSGSLSHNHKAPVVCEKISGLSAKGGASSLYFAFPPPVLPSRSRISQQLARKILPQRVTSLHPVNPGEEGNHRHSPRNFALQIPNRSSPPLVLRAQAIPRAPLR